MNLEVLMLLIINIIFLIWIIACLRAVYKANETKSKSFFYLNLLVTLLMVIFDKIIIYVMTSTFYFDLLFFYLDWLDGFYAIFLLFALFWTNSKILKFFSFAIAFYCIFTHYLVQGISIEILIYYIFKQIAFIFLFITLAKYSLTKITKYLSLIIFIFAYIMVHYKFLQINFQTTAIILTINIIFCIILYYLYKYICNRCDIKFDGKMLTFIFAFSFYEFNFASIFIFYQLCDYYYKNPNLAENNKLANYLRNVNNNN